MKDKHKADVEEDEYTDNGPFDSCAFNSHFLQITNYPISWCVTHDQHVRSAEG